MARRRCTTGLGTADSSGSLWYVDVDDNTLGWAGQLTGFLGASSVVPREDSTAFSTQLEGMCDSIPAQG